MDDKLFFKIEAIINWPKIKVDSYVNPVTKEAKVVEKFTSVLYFTKENYRNNLDKVFKSAKNKYQDATLKLKKIKDERPELNEILGEQYIYQHQANGQLIYIKCKDLFNNPLPLTEIKSGDRVYIKGCLKESRNPNNPNQKYITMYISSIAKIEDQVYNIQLDYDKDFDDDLEKYRSKYGIDSNDPDVNEEDEDVPEWEKP